MLGNGKWVADWQPVQARDAKGGFVRQTSSFRNWVTRDGSAGPTGEGGFKAAPGRYHLYVAPELSDQGWRLGTLACAASKSRVLHP